MNNDTKTLLAQIEALKKENANLKNNQTKSVSIAVSSKGAVSLYGVGRFPVTLYTGQWRKLLAKAEDIGQFLDEAEKLGAVATDKDTQFIQPAGLPLKFVAKVSSEPREATRPTPPATQAPASDKPGLTQRMGVTRYDGRGNTSF